MGQADLKLYEVFSDGLAFPGLKDDWFKLVSPSAKQGSETAYAGRIHLQLVYEPEHKASRLPPTAPRMPEPACAQSEHDTTLRLESFASCSTDRPSTSSSRPTTSAGLLALAKTETSLGVCPPLERRPSSAAPEAPASRPAASNPFVDCSDMDAMWRRQDEMQAAQNVHHVQAQMEAMRCSHSMEMRRMAATMMEQQRAMEAMQAQIASTSHVTHRSPHCEEPHAQGAQLQARTAPAGELQPVASAASPSSSCESASSSGSGRGGGAAPYNYAELYPPSSGNPSSINFTYSQLVTARQ